MSNSASHCRDFENKIQIFISVFHIFVIVLKCLAFIHLIERKVKYLKARGSNLFQPTNHFDPSKIVSFLFVQGKKGSVVH